MLRDPSCTATTTATPSTVSWAPWCTKERHTRELPRALAPLALATMQVQPRWDWPTAPSPQKTHGEAEGEKREGVTKAGCGPG